MTIFRTLLRKELGALFNAPIAYLTITVFLPLMGYTFIASLAVSQSASLVRVLHQAATLLLLFIPTLTMRGFSEERRHGTLELLMSTPAGDVAMVFAKFSACMTVLLLMLALTLIYPATLAYYGHPDWGPVYSGYLGLMLLSAALSALGLWISALTANQIVAATAALGMFVLLWILQTLGSQLPDPFDVFVVNCSLLAHFTPFSIGALYLSDVGYFATLTGFGLFLTVRALTRV